MSLIKWEPFDGFDRFADERLLPMLPKSGWDLAADVYEENSTVVVKMNLPGVAPENLDVSIEDDSLIISGRREEETETQKRDYYTKEIRRGSFYRTVPLPKPVEAASASGKFTDGILVVRMPKVKDTKSKAVPVNIEV
jgi:HSP20 family protein